MVWLDFNCDGLYLAPADRERRGAVAVDSKSKYNGLREAPIRGDSAGPEKAGNPEAS